MATGSGKTIVMAMLVAWQVLNKVASPQDRRFSKNVFVVAPGLTVRKRLAVLEPSAPGNYYEAFDMVPSGLREKLRQGRVLVRNWHALNWETDDQLARRRTVDKRGAKSDAAFAREVLGELASASNLLVINDEAHHAWRVPAGSKPKGVAKEEVEEATKWVGGLDRIHRTRGILAAFDFSATPFAPSGKESTEEALFDWIVSDFSLNDAIESGLGYGQWLHGEAVGCGMGMAADLSVRLGLIDAVYAKRLSQLIARAGLPTVGPALGAARYLELMRIDKKAEGGKMRFVVIEAPGRAGVRAAPDALVAQVIAANTA
jgi:hypothetical protein